MIAQSLFAGLTTIAFGFLYQVRASLLWISGVIGAIAWAASMAVHLMPGAGLLGDFAGAFVVGSLAELAALWKKKPVTIFVVPAIISFVPGYLVYESMVAFLKNNFNAGLHFGLTAVFAAAALGLGLALATALLRPLLRPHHFLNVR
ncbi:threonine/serine exporter family protein [Sulfobacillus sp. hq2]|uniref:threonine/serine exporter family protein n=1 Tax=Sulfobacillus TaxID=28033 RepID=UPI00156D5D54|nr:threonine/serine exporter family protein [Sulfobacillus sp. hq2]